MLDVIVDGLTEGSAGWWLLGGVALVGVAKGGRALAKGAIKGYFATRDGLNRLATGSRAGARRLYEEALAEYQAAPEAS